MEFKPGDIVHRKFSDKNDLYCVLSVYRSSIPGTSDVIFSDLIPYYKIKNQWLCKELMNSIVMWYEKVDLNDYEIKEKFLVKIKNYLKDNLGKEINHNTILDNLIYIEVLAALKKYETKTEQETDQ